MSPSTTGYPDRREEPANLHEQILEALRQSYGWDLSSFDGTFLAKMLEARRTATGTPSVREYLTRLRQDRHEAEELHQSLHIAHSEFFRNPLAFALLEELILPQLAAGKGGQTEIRVWSAGCAAGQEAYSVAILLDELAASRKNPVLFRIFATDRSRTELTTAQLGTYRRESLHNVRLKHVDGCFSRRDDTFTIVSRIRQRVDFSWHDLLGERCGSPPASIYGDFDLILCSNLLYYYQAGIQQLILSKLHQALTPRGYLVTGETEKAAVNLAGGFHALAPPAPVFQKSDLPAG